MTQIPAVPEPDRSIKASQLLGEYRYISGTMEAIILANNHNGQAQFAWDASSDLRFERILTPFSRAYCSGELD